MIAQQNMNINCKTVKEWRLEIMFDSCHMPYNSSTSHNFLKESHKDLPVHFCLRVW